MNLAPYKLSRDYGKLYELAQEMEIICLLYGNVTTTFCPKGCGCVKIVLGAVVLSARTKDDFVLQCEDQRIEWLVPEEVEVIKNCDNCYCCEDRKQYLYCKKLDHTVPSGTCCGDDWRLKESEE